MQKAERLVRNRATSVEAAQCLEKLSGSGDRPCSRLNLPRVPHPARAAVNVVVVQLVDLAADLVDKTRRDDALQDDKAVPPELAREVFERCLRACRPVGGHLCHIWRLGASSPCDDRPGMRVTMLAPG